MCIICLEWEKGKLTTDEAFKIVKSGEVPMSPEHTDEIMDKLAIASLGLGFNESDTE